MKAEVRSANVYRDFEKLYKLIGLYSGNLDQISSQVRYADAVLQENLKAEGEDNSLKFDFLMTSVFSDGREVFRSQSPELTMAYALFCEGVRSVIATEGLTGQELVEWCQLIRKHLSSTTGGAEDLASILWRNRSVHIRAQIYNALLNLEEIGVQGLAEVSQETLAETGLEKVLEKEHLESAKMAEPLSSKEAEKGAGSFLKMMEDQKFVLPAAQRFYRTVAQIDQKQLERLKSSLSDVGYSDKAKSLMRFNPEEVQALTEELESYNVNHVEFNLLVQIFSLIESAQSLDAQIQDSILRRLDTLIRSILQRFHTGLLSFLVKKLALLKNRQGFEKIYKLSTESVRKALDIEENRNSLLESLGSDEAAATAQELLQFYAPQQWPRLLDQVLYLKRPKAVHNFLKYIQKSSTDLESQLFAFGPERLKILIPHIVDWNWDKKQSFLLRCLQSRSPDVVAATLPYISRVKISSEQVLPLLERLTDRDRSRFLEALIDQKNFKEWEGVARVLVGSTLWRTGSENSALSVLRFVVYVLGEGAFPPLMSFVTERRWGFWARHPQERERILTALFSVRSTGLKSKLKELFQQEARLLFQSADLKERLKSEAQ